MVLFGAIGATFAPYTPLLGLQAIIVGTGTAITFELLKEKWAT